MGYNRNSGWTKQAAMTTGHVLTATGPEEAAFQASSGALPSGSTTQTLYHNGSTWVATSEIRTDGASVGINTAPAATTGELVVAGDFASNLHAVYATGTGGAVGLGAISDSGPGATITTGTNNAAIIKRTGIAQSSGLAALFVHADHASDIGPACSIRQDGTGTLLEVTTATVAKFKVETGATTMCSDPTGNAAMVFGTDSTLIVNVSGSTVDAGAAIPAGAVLLGVTARVTSALGGTCTSWSLGIPGDTTRWGSGIAKTLGTTTTSSNWTAGFKACDVQGSSSGTIRLTANGGTFGGGDIRIAVFYFTFGAPTG